MKRWEQRPNETPYPSRRRPRCRGHVCSGPRRRQISEPAGTAGDSLCAGRSHRHHRPHDGGMDDEHVPYKGSMPALQDMMSGNVAWMFETFSTTLQLHRAGKARILAYAHARRAPIAPEIPTMIEAGIPGYEAYTFNLILGPAGF